MRAHGLPTAASAHQHLALEVQRIRASEHQFGLLHVQGLEGIGQQCDKHPTGPCMQGRASREHRRAAHALVAAQYGDIAETAFVTGLGSAMAGQR